MTNTLKIRRNLRKSLLCCCDVVNTEEHLQVHVERINGWIR